MDGSRPHRKIKLGMKEGSQLQLQDLSDDVLEHILLRLGSGLWLIRAAAVCKRWRAVVVADTGFLTRFRHVPLVLGHYHTADNEWKGYREWSVAGGAVFLPCSAPVVHRRHLSLEFLPDCESWEVADSRGGLLLLSKKRTGREAIWHAGFPDMMVCEPLTGRCQAILSPPADLKKHDCIAMLLLDGDGGIHMSNFRVLAAVNVPLVSVFSSSSGGWRLAHNDLLFSAGIHGGYQNFLGRANGRLYMAAHGEDDKDVFVLDEATAAFSLVSFPANMWGSDGCDRWIHRMVGREDGALRAVRVTGGNDLKVFVQEPAGCGEWTLEKFLSLPEATRGLPGHQDHFFEGTAYIVAANERYVLITPTCTMWLFTVELDTMQVESLHERNKFPGEAYPYQLPWPPTLQACSTTSIHHN